jgi:hypothetical protein
VKCVEKVHFNDAIPEQQNSYITGLKSEYGYKFIDGKFIATDIDDLIDTIIENRKEDVREILENRKDMRGPTSNAPSSMRQKMIEDGLFIEKDGDLMPTAKYQKLKKIAGGLSKYGIK